MNELPEMSRLNSRQSHQKHGYELIFQCKDLINGARRMSWRKMCNSGPKIKRNTHTGLMFNGRNSTSFPFGWYHWYPFSILHLPPHSVDTFVNKLTNSIGLNIRQGESVRSNITITIIINGTGNGKGQQTLFCESFPFAPARLIILKSSAYSSILKPYYFASPECFAKYTPQPPYTEWNGIKRQHHGFKVIVGWKQRAKRNRKKPVGIVICARLRLATKYETDDEQVNGALIRTGQCH